MKVVLFIFASLALASCFKNPYAVSDDCSTLKCFGNTWETYSKEDNSTIVNSMTCPEARQAIFRKDNATNKIYFDLTAYSILSKNKEVSIPLDKNPEFNKTGVQY